MLHFATAAITFRALGGSFFRALDGFTNMGGGFLEYGGGIPLYSVIIKILMIIIPGKAA